MCRLRIRSNHRYRRNDHDDRESAASGWLNTLSNVYLMFMIAIPVYAAIWLKLACVPGGARGDSGGGEYGAARVPGAGRGGCRHRSQHHRYRYHHRRARQHRSA